MGWIHWIEAHVGTVQSLIALVLTVITGVYAYLTRGLLLEAKRQREQAGRPSIVAYLRPHEAHIQLMYLSIENTGVGAAHSVQLEETGLAEIPGDVDLRKHGAFSRGIAVMPPGARIDIFLCSAVGKWEQIKGVNATLTVRYDSNSGQNYLGTFPLDFSQFEGYEHVGRPPAYDIAKSVERMAKTIDSWPGKHGRFEVNVHSESEMAADRHANSLWLRIQRLSPSDRDRVESLVRDLQLKPSEEAERSDA